VRHRFQGNVGIGEDLHPIRPRDPPLFLDPIGEKRGQPFAFLALPADPGLAPRRELDPLCVGAGRTQQCVHLEIKIP
jgi:hypothetical protein